MQSVTIDAAPPAVLTQDATPVNVVLFEANPNSSINARLLVTARRPSDGATKCWDFTAAMRLGAAGGNAANLANVGAGAPFGASADLTALTAVAIAFFASGPNIGIALTGLAATDIEWGIMLRGIQVID